MAGSLSDGSHLVLNLPLVLPDEISLSTLKRHNKDFLSVATVFKSGAKTEEDIILEDVLQTIADLQPPATEPMTRSMETPSWVMGRFTARVISANTRQPTEREGERKREKERDRQMPAPLEHIAIMQLK